MPSPTRQDLGPRRDALAQEEPLPPPPPRVEGSTMLLVGDAAIHPEEEDCIIPTSYTIDADLHE